MSVLYSSVLAADSQFSDLVDCSVLYGVTKLRVTVDRGSARVYCGASPDAMTVLQDCPAGVTDVRLPMLPYVSATRLSGNSSSIKIEVLGPEASELPLTSAYSVSEAGVGVAWAARPSAAGNAGRVIRVTNVGFQASGSLWVSDGVNWNPLNGSVVLAQGSGAPNYPLTQNTGATNFLFTLPAAPMVAGGSVVIPAGMIVPAKGQLEAECWVRRVGANGTAALRMYLGVNNSASTDLNLAPITLPATTDVDANPGPIVTFPQALVAGTSSWLSRHSATAVAAGYEVADGRTNTAATMYFNIGVFSANAADAFRLVAYRLTLKQ